MIAEAQAAAANVVGVASEIGVSELIQWANLILFPIAAFIWKMDRKITKALTWMEGHDKLDDTRFKAFEQRHNSIDTAMEAIINHHDTATAGLKESNG